MTVAIDTKLDFDRTLPRALVHKVGIEQILLTGYAPAADREMLLAAQLPRSHGLYCENMIEAGNYDLAALVEICRQACFVVAHTQFDVPLEGNRYQFLFQELRATMVGSRTEILDGQAPHQPIQLLVRSSIEREWRKKGAGTSGLHWVYSLSIPDGKEVAQITIKQAWIERTKWRQIRSIMKRERNIAPDQAIASAPASELQPAQVARLNPHNVVLHSMRHLGADSYEAMARIDARHPVLFDRATEHIYAMIQIEVCRQMALYAASQVLGIEAMNLEMWRCDSSFLTIGELQIPAKVLATVKLDDAAKDHAVVSLVIDQQDRHVSAFEVGVRRIV